MRLAVDTGGTFTDLVVEDDVGRLHMHKVSTTPHDPIEGIMAAIGHAADGFSISTQELLRRVDLFIHGTTRATNAIVTGNTAKTAFLTTKGHPDILVLREGGKNEPFNFSIDFPRPYVPRALTFEVPERVSWDGKVIEPLDEESVIHIIGRLRELKVESVGVCLLWSTVNSVHETRVGELLEEYLPDIPFTLSHVLNPILREYHRASSTCIDASLKPLMSNYLRDLSNRLQQNGFEGRLLMLTSKGGIMDFQELAAAPIHSIGSGPSMAPVAGRYYAQTDSKANTAIVADTGGTTYDVSLIRRGIIPMTPETWLGQRFRGHILGFPSVDVRSIGAGGGSIAWVDEGGLLHVGPMSAGAVPGPVCYGRGGTQPTVTDAALVLGYIDPTFFLGGAMKLEAELAAQAVMKNIAHELGLGLHEAALAILRLATEHMVGAIDEITINQGIDPRTAVLVGGGGAAGLNVVAIARRLGCKTVVIPEIGAALSAAGALMSDLYADYRALSFTASDNFDMDTVNATLNSLEVKCRKFIEGPGARALDHSIEFHAEARYRGQIWEIDVPLRVNRFKTNNDIDQVRQDFDKTHEEILAFRDPDSVVEFVSWCATARCKLRDKEMGKLAKEHVPIGKVQPVRKAYFSNLGMVEVPVMLLESLKPHVPVRGPAIIEGASTTIVIEPGAEAESAESRSLLITLRR